MQTLLTVLTVSTWEFFTDVRGIEPRSAQLIWLACFLTVRDLSGRLLRLLQIMLRC
jgi:hypothetical protein